MDARKKGEHTLSGLGSLRRFDERERLEKGDAKCFSKKFEKGLTMTLKRDIISNVPIEEASRGRAVR